MDINALVELLKQHAPQVVQWALMALGALVVAGRAYVFLTPTQDDDKWLVGLEGKPVIGQLLSLLVAFSPVERKEKK